MACRVADRLGCLCAAFNLSVADFATRLRLPLRRARRLLRPDRKPSLKLLNRVHRAFPEISLHWLFCGEGTMLAEAASPGNRVGANYGTLHQTIYYGPPPI